MANGEGAIDDVQHGYHIRYRRNINIGFGYRQYMYFVDMSRMKGMSFNECIRHALTVYIDFLADVEEKQAVAAEGRKHKFDIGKYVIDRKTGKKIDWDGDNEDGMAIVYGRMDEPDEGDYKDE